MYGWIITQDFTEDIGSKYSAVGRMGPADISKKHEIMLNAGQGELFLMKDDDGEIYYHGRIVGDYDGFEPLDDFGMPNAGCTDIHYKNKQGVMSPL